MSERRTALSAHLACTAVLLLALGACASTTEERPFGGDPSAPAAPGPDYNGARPAPKQTWAAQPLQCVPYARQRSGVLIFGDAHTWPEQARGRYQISMRPRVGSVLMLGGTAGGHVAVVTAVLSESEILVDHANWANDGSIHLNAPVIDASGRGDWSSARVWHMNSGQMGARAYPVRGFILAP